MPFAPVTFIRYDADHYMVGAVSLRRQEDGTWAAIPPSRIADGTTWGQESNERPLFTASSLEEILDMAHGAVEMMRPAPSASLWELGVD